jgi:pimeloyl-ACP methyl ester carboxylesterase
MEAAAKVTCPTLVIAGQADRMSPAKAAAKLAAAIPDATLITLPNCGHMMMAEQPDETLDALIDALA